MNYDLEFDWDSYLPSEEEREEDEFSSDDELGKKISEAILRSIPKIDMVSKDLPLNSGHYVPCMPKNFQYPKLSALTKHQHLQCLKVLCADNPHILPMEHLPEPSEDDFKMFEDLKATYEKEQKEFKEWAKTQWKNKHYMRALTPRPPVENVYEAKFKMVAKEMESYPKMFDMAAQIPLETSNYSFGMVLTTDLNIVDIEILPEIECEIIGKKFQIINMYPVPKPCNRHPCRFILPNENKVSVLPLTEIQRELAQYAIDNNATFIASENALKTLLETDRSWDVILSVVDVVGPDGEKANVVVMGHEFSTNRESAVRRTYRAFKHLLKNALIPITEISKLYYKNNIFKRDPYASSDEDDVGLCVGGQTSEQKIEEAETQETELHNTTISDDDAGLYSCSCAGTIFERPPPRSFKKWQVRNKETEESYDIIIHCSHKVRDNSGEVILEPVPEYQLELGASAQSRGKIRSLALSLLLRNNATLINVRIDGATGEVATFENITSEEFEAKHGDYTGDISNTLHTALSQLKGLSPGTYILRHEANNGNNASLYMAKPSTKPMLELKFDSTQLAEADESSYLKTPPVIIPLLLPYHKYQKILPCAFTPHEDQVFREQKRPLKGKKPPPKALKMRKMTGKKKKRY